MARILLVFAVILMVSSPTRAELFRFGLPATHDFQYELAAIRLALDNAPGDHELEVVELPVVSTKRWVEMLESGYQGINLGVGGYDPSLEQTLLPVSIPLTRGLLGYRLMVVREDRLDELSNIHSLESLLPLQIGSGYAWPENSILWQNGIDLVLGHYENLWAMLARKRFDVFHRGVQEVFVELSVPGRENFAIVPGVALAFRFDYFLYVPGDRQDLQRILVQGLVNAYENGRFMALFESDPIIRESLRLADFDRREVIWLETPENRASIDYIPDRYWHDSVLRR
ncbi:hypothetical protein [Marinobacter bohaiensis]|uniref:hypothetical protein n=1 Tax=Marinobacter bohaiensis TaxID=2201898 RepID=UPI000DAE1ACA|nr:hypothetical protein [Marinobacter bohaiensis]